MPTIRRTATRDVVTVVIRGWKLIASLAIAFGSVALFLCLLQKPVYEATVTIFVTSAGSKDAPATPYENVMGSAIVIGSYARLAYTDAVVEPAIRSAGLNYTLDQAKKTIHAQVTPDTVMFTVSARSENPDAAERFADAVARSMIDRVSALEVPSNGGPPVSKLTIVGPSRLNPHPVSPTTLMDVTLATLGGLFVGMVGVLARERLNDTVRDARDVEKAAGGRPVEQIPHDAVLGAAEIIGFGAPATAAAHAFRRLRTALSVAHSERRLATILVTSPREGEGKSTVALNLAVAFVESGSTVVVVDAHLANPAVATRMGTSEAPGLADAISSQVPWLQRAATKDVKVIAAGGVGDHDLADLLASNACGNFFKQLAESFDYIIVDCPPLLEGPETEAIAHWADGVLLVARRGRSKISDTYASVARLSDIGAEVVGVVLNDVRLPKGRQAQERSAHHRAAHAAADRSPSR